MSSRGNVAHAVGDDVASTAHDPCALLESVHEALVPIELLRADRGAEHAGSVHPCSHRVLPREPHEVVSGSCSYTSGGLAGVDAPAASLYVRTRWRLVLDVLVAGVLGALELERGVRDGEVVARAFAEVVDDAIAAGAVGLVRDGHVRGDGHQV